MKILVTGGAGFIGSHTVEAIIALGHTARVFDNLSTGDESNLPKSELVEFVKGDITDADAVMDAVRGCDAIMHSAAVVSVPQSIQEPRETFEINTRGTVNLLEAARVQRIARFVFSSTCAVYGDLPGTKTESSELCPLVPYSASKLMAEEWAQVYARNYDLSIVRLRYFNVYGVRQHANSPYSGVLAKWTNAIKQNKPCLIFGNGEQTRDFVNVRDVAQANVTALMHSALEGDVLLNVATAHSVSLNDVLDALDTVAPAKVKREYHPPREGDIVHSSADSSRLQSLGWRPRVTLEEGLKELIH